MFIGKLSRLAMHFLSSLIVVLFALLSVANDAAASSEAQVSEITALEAGHWMDVKETEEAWRLRQGQKEFLKVEMGLELGDEIVVDRAVVVLLMNTGESLTLSRGARFVVGGEAGRAAAAVDAGIPMYSARTEEVITREIAGSGRLGEVTAVVAPNQLGTVTMVDKSDDGSVIRGGAYQPVRLGQEVLTGDAYETTNARIDIKFDTQERLSISTDTSIVLGPRIAFQEFGTVFYRLRDPYQISYGGVVITTDGEAELLVSGPDPVEVIILKGEADIVSTLEGEEVAKRRVTARGAMSAVQGSAVRTQERWGFFRRPGTLANAYATTGPVDEWGYHLVGGIADGVSSAGVRVSKRHLVYSHVAWVWDSALLSGVGSIRLPQSVGFELTYGLVDVGATAVGEFELQMTDCGTSGVLHGGGGAHLRFTFPLSRRSAIEAETRVVLTDEVTGTVGLGMKVAL